MTSDQKGVLAEAAVAWEATKLGVVVLRPFSPVRYDLVFDTSERLLRVQCKWAIRAGDVVIVRCATSRRGRSNSQLLHGRPDRCHRCLLRGSRAVLLASDHAVRGASRDSAPACALAQQSTSRNQLGEGLRIRGYTSTLWGRSSVGRAPEWHSGGHGFKPRRLHYLRRFAPRRRRRHSPAAPMC